MFYYGSSNDKLRYFWLNFCNIEDNKEGYLLICYVICLVIF